MAHDPKIVELINADIDGEISSADKDELAAYFAINPDARELREELSVLSASLDTLPELEAPPHLKYSIMASIPHNTRTQRGNSSNFLQSLLAPPALRYAAMFVAGSILTLSLVSFDRQSLNAFNDVTGLVGTISNQVPAGPGVHTTQIDHKEVAGTVTVHSSGSILIVDFDLVSSGPVEIVASYADQMVWFNGFAQLESPEASISAQSGRVTMQIEGKRRYVLYLRSAGDRKITIKLHFMSNGETIYDTAIEYAQPGQPG